MATQYICMCEHLSRESSCERSNNGRVCAYLHITIYSYDRLANLFTLQPLKDLLKGPPKGSMNNSYNIRQGKWHRCMRLAASLPPSVNERKSSVASRSYCSALGTNDVPSLHDSHSFQNCSIVDWPRRLFVTVNTYCTCILSI